MKTTTKRQPRAGRRPKAQEVGRAVFLDIARTLARYRADLAAFAAGDRGPVPADMAAHLRSMADAAGEDLLQLADYLDRDDSRADD